MSATSMLQSTFTQAMDDFRDELAKFQQRDAEGMKGSSTRLLGIASACPSPTYHVVRMLNI